MQLISKWTLGVTWIFLQSSCGTQPPSLASNGRCSRDCSAPFIADSDMRITFLEGDPTAVGPVNNLNLSCAPPTYSGLHMVRFMIEKPRRVMPAQNDMSPAGESGPYTDGAGTSSIKWEPVPRVSFFPIINGGVVTTGIPSGALDVAHWCTDSCGVGSFTFQPSCISQTVKIQVHSGSRFNELNLTIQPVASSTATSALLGTTGYSLRSDPF